MQRFTFTLLLLLSAPFAMAIEEPKHQVIESSGKFEIRQYAPMLQAQVETTGERGEAINAGFKILAGYIFGGNTAQEKIAMTAPVTQAPESAAADKKGEKIAMTAPVTQQPVGTAGEQRWRVAFMMPGKYTLESLPKPNDARIKFVTAPGEKRAVVVFDGFSTQSNLQTHRALLEGFVKERGLKTTGEYSLAFYNDPFTLPWNRRNEWWVAVQ
jgi:SOUL heme-binding protein